jgi:hypothetical protein
MYVKLSKPEKPVPKLPGTVWNNDLKADIARASKIMQEMTPQFKIGLAST